MTSPPEQISAKCPECANLYGDWYQPSINLAIEDFDEESLDAASSSTCPSCGQKVSHEVLTAREEDGVWVFTDGGI